MITKNEAANRNQVAQRDWVEFLWNLEEKYWNEIRNYVKNDLGTKAPIVGTVVGNSTPNLMAQMDVIDSHAYWHHPSFEISWGGPWWIGNSSMLKDFSGTVGGLACKRVYGKPFIVTEYNHPDAHHFRRRDLFDSLRLCGSAGLGWHLRLHIRGQQQELE